MSDLELFTEANSPLEFRIGNLSENMKTDTDKRGRLIVRRVPATICGEKNANGRIYTSTVMESAIGLARTNNMFESPKLACSADDHPESTFVKPIHASHYVIDAYIERVNGRDVLFNDWMISSTHNGEQLKNIMLKDGASIGTSIRGLGRQDEVSGEIKEYKYLGTDVVGNPSAGTFACFNGMTECFESSVEWISESEAQSIEESIVEVKEEMFDLNKAINSFKEQFGETPEITRELVKALFKIEQDLLNSGATKDIIEQFDEWKIEVLGNTIDVAKTESVDEKAESAKNADVLNKTQRKLEGSEVIISHLKDENNSLEEQLTELKNWKNSANTLMNQFAEKASEAVLELENAKEVVGEEFSAYDKACKEAAEKVLIQFQKEAVEVIENLEYQLEAAVQIGDIIGEHFFAMKACAEALQDRLLQKESDDHKKDKEEKRAAKGSEDVKSSSKKKEESFVESKASKVTRKPSNDVVRRHGAMKTWK